MTKSYSLDESFDLLEEISVTFVEFLGNLLEITKTDKINLVGIGNSISAGWTAVDNNVQPWLEKLRPFIERKCKRAGIQLEFGTFSLAGNNSNQQIYEFLKNNPSLADVKIHFMTIFDNWKQKFNGTLFENYVDKERALKYYLDSSKTFSEFYSENTFTISSFHGCTGELLNDTKSIFTKNGLNHIMQKELLYLQKILLLLQKQSEHSYITIGNFPKMSRGYLFLLNHIISGINEIIKM